MPSSTFFRLPAEKREKFLGAAAGEFARVPYDRASINQIIRAAGISRGSFYMYFQDKEELFYFILQDYGQRMLASVERQLEANGGDLFSAFLGLYDQVVTRFQDSERGREYEIILQILRINGDVEPTRALSLDPAVCLERLRAKIDESRLNLSSETDLADILIILAGVTGPAIRNGCLSGADGNVRRRYVHVLHILARGMAKEPATVLIVQ